jgi:hypothetical protein
MQTVLIFSPFLFLYSYKADFLQGFLTKNEKKLTDPLIAGSAI